MASEVAREARQYGIKQGQLRALEVVVALTG